MARTSNWNKDARVIENYGPQNPYRVYVFDYGWIYAVIRYKPGTSPRYDFNLVAIFTVKYYYK